MFIEKIVSIFSFQLTLFVHCYFFSKKTPATPSHYSALSLKYGAGGSGRLTSVPRNPVVQIGNESEIIEIKDLANGDDVRINSTQNCNQLFSSIILANADKMHVSNFNRPKFNYNTYVMVDSGISECSRQTSTTTVSRNNSASSFKKSSFKTQKKFSSVEEELPGIHKVPHSFGTKKKSSDNIARRFIKCTKRVLTFKNRNHIDSSQLSPYGDKKEIDKQTAKLNDNDSNTISNSSLREIDEEFNSAELEEFLAQIRMEKT